MQEPRTLSVFPLAMISVAAIATLQNLPVTAEYGAALITYLILAALVFFLPTALVSAELATGWPHRGGVYLWVKEALGSKWGFLAICLQWSENVVWYPTGLSFVAATVAYIFEPALAHNKLYTFSIIVSSFWVTTFANLFGMKVSGWISSISAILGTIAPCLLIIGLACFWFISGHPSQISFSWHSLFPDFTSTSHLVFLVGIVFSLAGMEMSAVHVADVKDPQKSYPKAILLATVIILAISIFGSLAIAIVIPHKQISLVAGVMEAFNLFFNAYGLSFLTPVIAILTALGVVGTVNTWIVGPSKGLLVAGQDGDLPPILRKTNRHNVPIALLLFQGCLVTILASLFLFMPTVNSSFWILTALTTQLYLLMYVLMFISALVLRYKAPHVHRAYRVPGKTVGMWITCILGIASSVFCILIGFIPPSGFPKEKLMHYILFLVFGILFMCALPLLIIYCRKKKTE